VAALRGERLHSRDKDMDLESVPDIKDIMPRAFTLDEIVTPKLFAHREMSAFWKSIPKGSTPENK
jgi:hypothetical protein